MGSLCFIGKIEGNRTGSNPVPLAKNSTGTYQGKDRGKIKKAVELFENFSGNQAEYVDTFNIPVPDVALKIGQLDGVMYTTNRDGKTEHYIHKFKKSSRPLFAVTFDGDQLIMIGGSYHFTEKGIVDT